MASDMFLKIKGIEGGSTDSVHTNEIDVLSWQWGLTNGSYSIGVAGASPGKVDVHDFTFTKPQDKATGSLLRKVCQGDEIEEVLLTVRKAAGDPIEFMKIKMNRVHVTSLTTGLAAKEGSLIETVALRFASFEVTVQPMTGSGQKHGGTVVAGFDIEKNKLT